MSVSITVDSSHLAFSAASLSRCSAIRSLRRSIPWSLLELVGQVVDDALIEVLAAEEGVAVGRLDLEHAFAQFENRNVERAAAEIEDRDLLVLLLVQTVGQRCRRRLVDDSQHVQPAIRPASLVACRWLSLKYAGTVITASVTFSPR